MVHWVVALEGKKEGKMERKVGIWKGNGKQLRLKGGDKEKERERMGRGK